MSAPKRLPKHTKASCSELLTIQWDGDEFQYLGDGMVEYEFKFSELKVLAVANLSNQDVKSMVRHAHSIHTQCTS